MEYVDPLHKPEWYLKHALHGEGPVLQYGKEVAGGVAECLKLLDKAKHEAPVLMRDGVDAIMPLVESIQPIFLEFLRNRAPDKQVEITERLNERLSEISEQLKGPFMLGEEFSAADCLLLAWMERVVEIGKTFEEKKWTWEAVAQSVGTCVLGTAKSITHYTLNHMTGRS